MRDPDPPRSHPKTPAKRRSRFRWGWGVFGAWALLALLAWSLASGVIAWPDRWNPWAPLWPLEAPNALTRWKLERLQDDREACATALRATAAAWTAVPDRATVRGCGWTDAVRVWSLPASLDPPVVLTCPAAVSLAMWQHHVVQPQAIAAFGQRVVAVHDFGSFACRDIGGRVDEGSSAASPGRRSEHARANAIDIAGFTLAGGDRIDVRTDWPRADDARGRFLRGLRDGACSLWSVVLTPDFNAAHLDHLHLDLGASRACR